MSAEQAWTPRDVSSDSTVDAPIWRDRNPSAEVDLDPIRAWLGLDAEEAADADEAEDSDLATVLPIQRVSTPSIGWTVLQDLRARRDLV